MVEEILMALFFPFLISVDHFEVRCDNFIDHEEKLYVETLKVNSLKDKSILVKINQV